jgi:cytochrome P450
MTDVELRDELVTLLAAGHETTATALAWAFDLLLHNPGSLERLQAEIADGSSDEYLGAVIEETLRVRPVVPGVMRKLKAPFQLDGYELQPGMRVAPNIYLTHRRSDVYPDPQAFRPERFLEQPTETYSWIPFGGGIRRCLGASFAIFEMKVAITTVLKRLELRAAQREPDRIRRRAITFAPERDAMVVVERRRERPATLPEDARAAV